MLRRSPFLIILSVLGVICFVFFGLMLSPLAGKLFGSSAVSFAPAALAAPTATPAPVKYDSSLTWYLYNSTTGEISTCPPSTEPPLPTEPPAPTSSVPPDYWFKGAGSDPAYLEEDASDFAGVGEGETPAYADQQTEPPRPSY